VSPVSRCVGAGRSPVEGPDALVERSPVEGPDALVGRGPVEGPGALEVPGRVGPGRVGPGDRCAARASGSRAART